MSLSPELETTLFRITQEAVSNIQRHSQAKKAVIRLAHSAKEVELHIEDDGCGFVPPQSQNEAVRLHQWGLVGMQERVELVGGSFEISSEPGQGMQLHIRAPLATIEE
jgi:two-component system sensor histidine kinase DegS